MEKLSGVAFPLQPGGTDFQPRQIEKFCPSVLNLAYSLCFSNQWGGEDLDLDASAQNLCFLGYLLNCY